MRLEQDGDILLPQALGDEPQMVSIEPRMQEPCVQVLFIRCDHVSEGHALGYGVSLCKPLLASQTLSLLRDRALVKEANRTWHQY